MDERPNSLRAAIAAARGAAGRARKARGILAPVEAERDLAEGFTGIAVGSDPGPPARRTDAPVASFERRAEAL